MTRIKMIIPTVLLGLIPFLTICIATTETEAETSQRRLNAYVPNPVEVVAHINTHTRRHLEKMDAAKNRRALAGEAGGGCKATNPIDECWMCKPWDGQDRFKLVDCVMGFGKQATGGKGGEIYTVNTSDDDDVAEPKPGTLRYGVTRVEPMWVVFDKDMKITLKEELMIANNTTIDGRGALVEIVDNAALSIFKSDNIIVHNIKVHKIKPTAGGPKIISYAGYVGPRSKSDGDGIQIFASTNIWVDHLTMSECADGVIDAVMSSTAITVSNCHFSNHDHTLLFGDKEDVVETKKTQITVAFNFFDKGLVQRLPACTHGFFHVVNNDYKEWELYAIGGRSAPTIILQGNRFVAGEKRKEVTHRDGATEEEWKTWTWVTDGDLYENGAFFREAGDQEWYKSHPEVKDGIEPAPADRVAELTANAGVLACTAPDSCTPVAVREGGGAAASAGAGGPAAAAGAGGPAAAAGGPAAAA